MRSEQEINELLLMGLSFIAGLFYIPVWLWVFPDGTSYTVYHLALVFGPIIVFLMWIGNEVLN